MKETKNTGRSAHKKLSLNKETIKRLTEKELRGVHGGITACAVCDCPTFTCDTCDNTCICETDAC
jgi:hypothetical protein